MDDIIKTYPSINYGELNYCNMHNLAYQRDMSQSVSYDKEYFEKYCNYRNTDIAFKINESRISMVKSYINGNILDIGIGSGEFIERFKKLKVYGFDINPFAIDWLKKRKLFLNPYTDDLSHVKGFTFWDSLEHIKNPSEIIRKVPVNSYVFISMPVYPNLLSIRKSKHYRPDEHYYYFTKRGLKCWMWDLGFHLLMLDSFEVDAGREDIWSFVFKKVK